VEQACHRCGSPLTRDTAFCSQCGAPQVRVPESISAANNPESSGISSAEAVPGSIPGAALNWRHALPSASAAGFAMAVASMLPLFSTFFPLWMLGGGWLAVTLYRRRSSLLLLTSTIGGKVGALAGLLGFAFFAVFTSAYLAIATVVLHKGEEIRATLRSVLDQAASTNHDVRAQELSQWIQTPEGLALIVALSMLLFLVAFLLLSTAGGIFGASLSRRKLR
jgi:hypothetical protein